AVRPHADRQRHRPRVRRAGGARSARHPRGRRERGARRMTSLPVISARRRRRDRAARAMLAAGTAIALGPLVLILYYVINKGLGAWSVHFFTTDPSGKFFGDPGGIRSAVLGTLEIVGLATLIAVPFG